MGGGRGDAVTSAGAAQVGLDADVVHDRGHQLVTKFGFVMCRLCGAYVSRGARRLQAACTGPLPPLKECSPAERMRRSRRDLLLRQERHPTTGAQLGVTFGGP